MIGSYTSLNTEMITQFWVRRHDL